MPRRQELPPLCGRDHMAYRSYHFVIKDCVDGDLVELYGLLPSDVQAQIAAGEGERKHESQLSVGCS